jgi:hypothetical protein
LSDRIDVVVKALHFNTRFLDELVYRIEEGVRPEKIVPPQIVFTPEELDRIESDIRGVTLPQKLRRRLEFFASHFEFFEPGARQLEYMTKDTVKLSDVDAGALAAESGKDPLSDLGAQTRNGLSVRALMTCIAFIKAMAYFRGEDTVSVEDMRQMLPFVSVGGRLYAFDRQACFSVHADAFGATLQRFGTLPPKQLPPTQDPNAETFDFGTFDEAQFRALIQMESSLSIVTTIAAMPTTLALTVSHSHTVFLVA